MQEDIIKELAFKLPKEIIKTIDDQEIYSKLADKTLAEFEYYKNKCKEMEDKYDTDFYSFKQRFDDESGKENSAEYNDLLLWESYELAFREWDHKCRELIG